ncbi:MAG: type II secretion system protein [Alteromonadaceae bacterium]|nr:type II secretion system protein [Alteromonadaceae bacterium]
MINSQKNQGFTLVELIVVIVLLGILSATAFPHFINLSSDARIKVITQIKVSVKTANDLLYLKSFMPSYSVQPVLNRPDLIDIDMDHDGNFDVIGANKVDIRLKYHYIDNTDIIKRIDISDDFLLKEEGIDFTYLGYDLDNNGQVKNDNCYFKYTQAQSEAVPAAYVVISSGC